MENNPTWICVVAVALSDDRGRWLMQQRPYGKAHAGQWEFPGGKVERGENPVEALVREIDEELGIQLDPHRLKTVGFAQSPVDGNAIPIVILLYTAQHWQGDPQSLENGRIGWFTPDEIALLDKPPLDLELARCLSGGAAN